MDNSKAMISHIPRDIINVVYQDVYRRAAAKHNKIKKTSLHLKTRTRLLNNMEIGICYVESGAIFLCKSLKKKKKLACLSLMHEWAHRSIYNNKYDVKYFSDDSQKPYQLKPEERVCDLIAERIYRKLNKQQREHLYQKSLAYMI